MRARLYWWTFRHYRSAPFDSWRATFWWRLGCRVESKPRCVECGGALEERPLAVRCTKCRALFPKPGVDYGNVMADE